MDVASKSYANEELISCFDQLGLEYEQVEHEPVFTIEDALAATPHLEGIKTKNVFLRDAKGACHFLVIVPHDRRLDLAKLALALNVSKLSMGSPDRLLRYLGVTPGAVSVFALINEQEKAVELVVDEKIWNAARMQGHPLQNTSTVSVTHSSLERFLSHTGHEPRVIQMVWTPPPGNGAGRGSEDDRWPLAATASECQSGDVDSNHSSRRGHDED